MMKDNMILHLLKLTLWSINKLNQVDNKKLEKDFVL